MPWNWPVDVNCHEAQAFCRWKSEVTGKQIQLPSEAEWYCLREQIDSDQPYWDAAPGNINLEYWASSCPVDQFRTGDFCDIIGNVWQWTTTAIDGYDGFRVHPCYDDFSIPTFDGRHNLIKGRLLDFHGQLCHQRFSLRLQKTLFPTCWLSLRGVHCCDRYF